VVWIDELATLSEKLPAADRVMLGQLRASAKPGGGEWQLDGLVSDVATLKDIERGVSDEKHDVEHKASQQREGDSRYKWVFKSAVLVKNEPDKVTAEKPGTRAATGAARPSAASGRAAGPQSAAPRTAAPRAATPRPKGGT